MVKSLSSNVVTRLGSGALTGAFLIEMSLRGDSQTTRRYTTAPYDLTYNSNSYTSSVDVLSVVAPDTTTILDDQAYAIEFADTGNIIQGLLDSENSLNGSVVTVRVVIADASNSFMLNASDVFIGYSGFINGVEYEFADGDYRRYVLRLGSPFSDFDAVEPRVASSDFQNNFSSTDTAFDNLFKGAEDVTLEWGRV